MNKFLLSIFLAAVVALQAPIVAPVVAAPKSVTADVHPTEAKYDKIMGKYASGLKTAFAEKDDNKTITMVNKLNDELVTEMEKIKPEIERWIKGMTEADKEAFEQRAGNKPYLKTIFEVMFNPETSKRIEANPKLKSALEAGSQRMKDLGFENEEEETYEEDGR